MFWQAGFSRERFVVMLKDVKNLQLKNQLRTVKTENIVSMCNR
jgi:hypothetical protein